MVSIGRVLVRLADKVAVISGRSPCSQRGKTKVAPLHPISASFKFLSELQVSQRASSFQLVPSPISGARLQTLKSSLSQSGEGVHRRGGRPVRLLCDQSNALE